MQNNNVRKLTLSEAYKVYCGESYIVTVMKMMLIGLTMFAGVNIFIFFSAITEYGIHYTEHLTEEDSLISNIFLILSGCYMGFFTLLVTKEKTAPGGKYFRTVTGGFDTFKKVTIAQNILVVASSFLFYGLLAILDILKIISFRYGTMMCITAFIFILLAKSISNFIMLIKNATVRMILVAIVFYAVAMCSMILCMLTGKNGNNCIAAIVSAAITAILFPLSIKCYIKNYRNNHWDN